MLRVCEKLSEPGEGYGRAARKADSRIPNRELQRAKGARNIRVKDKPGFTLFTEIKKDSICQLIPYFSPGKEGNYDL